MIDLIPRKSSTEARASHAGWSDNAIEALPYAAFCIDREHRVVSWNLACERLTGKSAASMLNTTDAWSAFYPTQRPLLADLIVDGRQADIPVLYNSVPPVSTDPEQGVWEIEEFVPNLQGGRWISFSAALIRNDDGEIIGAIEVVRDIAVRKGLEQAQREGQSRLEQIIEGCAIPMFVLDENHVVTHWNRASVAALGIPAEDMLGTTEAWRAFYPSPRPVLSDLLLDNVDAETIRTRYHGNALPVPSIPGAWEGLDSFDSGTNWYGFSAAPLRGLDGRIVGAVQTFRDMTAFKQYQLELERRSTHDSLTGLPNRDYLTARLDEAVAAAERQTTPLGVLFIDLDGFKLVNDNLGHLVGDELLIAAGKRLQSVVRDGDISARISGDEFVVVATDQVTGDVLARLAARIITALDTPFQIAGQEVHVSASAGIAVYPEDGRDAQALLKSADAAMYRAKSFGKRQYQFFERSYNQELAERAAIKMELRRAIDREEFSLNFQPKCDLAHGHITGFEALLRWHSPVLGEVSPAKFIPILEETGDIIRLGDWVIAEAVRQLSAWHSAGHDHLTMAVNLSVRQLWQADLAESVRGVLMENGVYPAQFEFEITESMIMQDVEHVMASLHAISQIGIQISMDDFGTGYSSLSYLKRFPINTIKIDRSFIKDLAHDADDLEIVRTIISMGRALRRHIIAEGVETIEQKEILRRLRCDEMQGNFLSAPLTAADATALLERVASRD